MEPSGQVRKRTETCRTLFTRCLSIPIFTELDWFDNRQGEFNLWTAGLKAATIGTSSLDHRVRDSPEVRELICDLLDGLSEALEHLLQTAESQSSTSPLATELGSTLKPEDNVSSAFSGFSTEGSKRDSLPSIGEADGPFSEQMFNIKTILGQLARISTAIRRSGTRYRYRKADASLKEEDFKAFKTHLTFVILTGSIQPNAEEPANSAAIRPGFSDPKQLTTVQKRLIHANIVRRNRIIIATRSMKPAEKPIEMPAPKAEPTARLPPGSKRLISDEPVVVPRQASSVIAPSITQTATEIGSQFKWQTVAPSVMTRVTRTGAAQDYPNCPEPNSDKSLQCPYCADLLPVEYSKNQPRWKGHVTQDILPYMCIYEHCETPDEMYLTSDELFAHMRSQHSVIRWVCDHCASKSEETLSFVFESLEEWESHMYQKHSTAFPSSQLSSLAKVSQRRMLEPISCPLCAYSTAVSQWTLDTHIAQHLHGFALRCLPWGTGDNEMDSVKAKSADGSNSNGLTDEDIEDGESTYLNVTEANKPTELVRTLRDIFLRIRYKCDTKVLMVWPNNGEQLWRRLQLAETELNGRFFGPELPTNQLSEALGSHMLKIIQILYQALLGWEHIDGKEEIARGNQVMLEDELDALDAALSGTQSELGEEDLDNQASPAPTSSTADNEDNINLEKQLRMSQIKHEDGQMFFSAKDISRILSKEKIASELEQHQLSKDISVDVICEMYLRVFALLLLLERQGEIVHFVKEEVRDGALPVVPYQDMYGLCLRSAPDKPLGCFENWRTYEREYFNTWQYRISVPFFALEHGSGSNEMIAPHYTFDDGTVLPWCARDMKAPSSAHSTGLSERNGGFATVLRVRMDPRCHGFQEILDKIYLSQEYFALKVLHEAQWNDQKKFQFEVDQLKRFNGLVHAHLVTLLATFTLKKRFHFLFPYAECDLDLYWETKVPNPSPEDLNTVLWFSDQIRGIMEAISMIHNPPHIQGRFGRHGDLKPDNILWYKHTKHSNGIFVVSDMGLSSLNREGSRSNIPNKSIPPTPGYRPPECDVENGTISRAYDIWTLGCLFMEMVVWFLGGNKWLQEFSNDRRTVVYLTGSVSNIFFDIKTIDQENTEAQEVIEYVIQVKPEVAKWFQKIRSHEQCTQFILEIIEIIELEMLVVLSADKTRSTAAKLKGKFNDIHKNCETTDYCMKRVPVPSIVRVATAVEANLNENARQMISDNRPRLSTHEGEAPRKSMPSDEMKKMN